VVAEGTQRLNQAWRVEEDYDAVKSVCLELVQEISGTSWREPSDPRVLATIDYIRRKVDQTSGHSSLKASRFQALPTQPGLRTRRTSHAHRARCSGSRRRLCR